MNARIFPKVKIPRFVAGLILAGCLVAVAAIFARQKGVAHMPLPVNLIGKLEGTAYRIRVPAAWNGTLLIYGHSARPGAVPSVAEIAPPTYPAATPPLEEQLLSLGYGLAGSEFKGGHREGIQCTLALTNFFRGAVGNPKRIIAWGDSLGGAISATLIEKYPGIYDAAIANCAPLAKLKDVDASLAFGLAFAVTFFWLDQVWGPLEDPRDGLVPETDIIPHFPWYMPSHPERFGPWEFIRLVMKLPPDAFWKTEPLLGVPFYGLMMWKALVSRAGVAGEANGRVAQNLGHVYTLTDAEKAYLAGKGVNADYLLAQMNARTNIEARRPARLFVEHWYGFKGSLKRPIVTMHAINDGMSRVANQTEYRKIIEQAGNADKLVQVYVNAAVHLSFSTEQILATLTAMEYWLDTGIRPDASFFPASAGFNNSYVPPAWPF